MQATYKCDSNVPKQTTKIFLNWLNFSSRSRLNVGYSKRDVPTGHLKTGKLLQICKV